jgi:hypothetical protein
VEPSNPVFALDLELKLFRRKPHILRQASKTRPLEGIRNSSIRSLGVVVAIKQQRRGAGTPRILGSHFMLVCDRLLSAIEGGIHRVSDSPDRDSDTLCLVQTGIDNL